VPCALCAIAASIVLSPSVPYVPSRSVVILSDCDMMLGTLML
jgi:hypothetical protein